MKTNEELIQKNNELKEEVAELKRQLDVIKKLALKQKSERMKQNLGGQQPKEKTKKKLP